MKYTETELLELLKFGEKISLECKKAGLGLPNSIWSSYSAFANTIGGDIILGIEEVKEPDSLFPKFVVEGVTNVDKLIKDFWNTINSEKTNHNILSEDNVYALEVEKKTVIVISIPQADYRQRPVFINGNPYKGAYKRNYEGDYHCSEEEVREMLRDSNDSGNDGFLIEGYNLDDIDNDSLRAYRTEFELKNPDHVWNTVDNIHFLTNLGCYTKDRNTGKEGLTLAGLLMFGKGLPIRERFDNIRMDYIDKTNVLPGMRWSDRVTYDGRWENNLYNFFKIVIRKLTSDLRRPFVLEGITRVDDTPVHKAVREAVTNMIIHSDYLMNGILKVEKQDNCLKLSNPGNLKLPISVIYKGGNSKARNPRMQNVLRMIGYGDNIGSGFPTILDAWKKENWRKPDLREDVNLHQVDLDLWMVSLLPEECTAFMQSHFGSGYDALSSHQQIILCTAYVEKQVSNSRLQPLLETHSVDVAKDLKILVDKGFLLRNNNGRWTTYEINSSYVKETSEGPSEGPSWVQVGSKLGPSWDQARKILSFCLSEHTLIEIMAELQMTSRDKFRKNYIMPLLNGGLLERTQPDKPNSSKQKYVITVKGKGLLSQQ